MGNKQRGKMKKRLLVAALAACMAFPASLPAQAAGTVHGKKVGWIQEKGQTYYCDPSTLQNVRGKWQLIGKNYYYFDQLGRLIRNKWVGNYHVGDNGALEKNKWIGKYFVGENGKWIKKFKGGWYKINKKWYYYTKEGVKKTGWLKYKGNKYYLDKNGVRLTKWQKIKNTTYYFTKKGKQRMVLPDQHDRLGVQRRAYEHRKPPDSNQDRVPHFHAQSHPSQTQSVQHLLLDCGY